MVIGIDLGTTNCALAWSDPTKRNEDLPNSTPPINPLAITQLTHPGNVEERYTLPSFLYFPGSHELPPHSIELPWNKEIPYVVGWLARDQGAKVPQRVISSAKSWLSNDRVDRTLPLLPWNSPEEVEHISPVEASKNYLLHLREAWDYAHPEEPFCEQDVVITVPASFDTIARELTVKAASQAGIEKLTLLEEPQAAFYAWLDKCEENWRKQVEVGDRVLVCDVGGGTTDFSLITVNSENGDLTLERTAVGNHILLGGDNMDLALAVFVQQKLKKEQNIKLDNWQMQVLTHACRSAKEQLLQEDGETEWSISIPGRGRSLIASSIQATLTNEEVQKLVVDGFFPICQADDYATRSRQSGLRELGLPFESNPAITKHLASFLGSHKLENSSESFLVPTAILFNGGVFKSPAIRDRVVNIVNSWLNKIGKAPLKVLQGADYDLAVARGAVRCGLNKYGLGIRIKAGTNRSYYIGIESSMPAIPGLEAPIKALCIAPFGMEEESTQTIPGRSFGLVVGEPAEFRFLASTARHKDKIGDLIDDWDEDIEELTSLCVTLPAEAGDSGNFLPVTLQTHITELGTLELWCCQDDQPKWRLEFETRNVYGD